MFFIGKTQLVPAGYVVTKNALGGSVWGPNKIETPKNHTVPALGKEERGDFLKICRPFFLAKTRVWQKTIIATRSGVKKYARWCTRIPKTSSDDPCLALFHIFAFFDSSFGSAGAVNFCDKVALNLKLLRKDGPES